MEQKKWSMNELMESEGVKKLFNSQSKDVRFGYNGIDHINKDTAIPIIYKVDISKATEQIFPEPHLIIDENGQQHTPDLISVGDLVSRIVADRDHHMRAVETLKSNMPQVENCRKSIGDYQFNAEVLIEEHTDKLNAMNLAIEKLANGTTPLINAVLWNKSC